MYMDEMVILWGMITVCQWGWNTVCMIECKMYIMVCVSLTVCERMTTYEKENERKNNCECLRKEGIFPEQFKITVADWLKVYLK